MKQDKKEKLKDVQEIWNDTGQGNQKQTTVRVYQKDIDRITDLYETQIDTQLKMLNYVRSGYQKMSRDTGKIDKDIAHFSVARNKGSLAEKLEFVLFGAMHDFTYTFNNLYEPEAKKELEIIQKIAKSEKK
ncbi:MAG: hypothetical protein ABIH20_06115 [Candidatus Diapherotrites archaeon]